MIGAPNSCGRYACESLRSREFRTVLVLSLCFMFVFTGYFPIEVLQSSLNENRALGVISLSSLHGATTFSIIFTPLLVSVIGTKASIVAAWCIHLLYIVSNFFPSFVTLVPSSILLGAISGPLWASQSIYITTNSLTFSSQSEASLFDELVRFSGIFSMCYESSQVTGNLLSSMILQSSLDEMTLTNATACGVSRCSVDANFTIRRQPGAKSIHILLAVLLGSTSCGLVLTVFCLPPMRRRGTLSVSTKEMSAWLLVFKDRTLLLLIPFFVAQAVNQTVLRAEYTRMFVACSLGVHMIGFVVAAYGSTLTLFSFLLGTLSKTSSRGLICAAAGFIDITSLVILLLWIPTPDHYILFYVLPVAWGISTGIWKSENYHLIGSIFPDKLAEASVILHIWKSFGYSLAFGYSKLMCLWTKLLIASILVSVGTLSCIVAEKRCKRNIFQGKDDEGCPDGIEMENVDHQ